MPVRVFSNEDGNLNSKSVIVSRTKQNADIDLSFSAKFIGLDSDGTNLRADVFKKTNATLSLSPGKLLFRNCIGIKEAKSKNGFNNNKNNNTFNVLFSSEDDDDAKEEMEI